MVVEQNYTMPVEQTNVTLLTDLGPKVTDQPNIFHFTSIWSSTGASETNFIK